MEDLRIAPNLALLVFDPPHVSGELCSMIESRCSPGQDATGGMVSGLKTLHIVEFDIDDIEEDDNTRLESLKERGLSVEGLVSEYH